MTFVVDNIKELCDNKCHDIVEMGRVDIHHFISCYLIGHLIGPIILSDISM